MTWARKLANSSESSWLIPSTIADMAARRAVVAGSSVLEAVGFLGDAGLEDEAAAFSLPFPLRPVEGVEGGSPGSPTTEPSLKELMTDSWLALVGLRKRVDWRVMRRPVGRGVGAVGAGAKSVALGGAVDAGMGGGAAGSMLGNKGVTGCAPGAEVADVMGMSNVCSIRRAISSRVVTYGTLSGLSDMVLVLQVVSVRSSISTVIIGSQGSVCSPFGRVGGQVAGRSSSRTSAI